MPAPSPDPRREHEHRDATEAEARALSSGLRLRILRLCLDQPLTNREIAEALDKHPATVLHHVRTLVDTGYLEAQEPRRGRRGAREIPYRTTGKSWYTRSPVGSSSMLEAFLAEVERAPAEHKAMTRMALRLPEEEMAEFRQRLRALLTEFHDRPRDPDAEPWSLFVALHPDTSRPGRRQGAAPASSPASASATAQAPDETARAAAPSAPQWSHAEDEQER